MAPQELCFSSTSGNIQVFKLEDRVNGLGLLYCVQSLRLGGKVIYLYVIKKPFFCLFLVSLGMCFFLVPLNHQLPRVPAPSLPVSSLLCCAGRFAHINEQC